MIQVDIDSETGRKRVRTFNEEPSRTDCSYTEDCDVNEIMRRFKATGQVTHVAKREGCYGDFSNVPDLIGAFQIKKEAEQAFMKLPAKMRRKFNNSMEDYVEFVMNPANKEECIDMGLIEKSDSADKRQDTGTTVKSSGSKAKAAGKQNAKESQSAKVSGDSSGDNKSD